MIIYRYFNKYLSIFNDDFVSNNFVKIVVIKSVKFEMLKKKITNLTQVQMKGFQSNLLTFVNFQFFEIIGNKRKTNKKKIIKAN